MSETACPAFLSDPRLADLAVAALPAWLWTTDGRQILWANAVGAAMFGAAGPAALAQRRFDARHPAAQQVARLGASLPPQGARLERLRGFPAGVGRVLTGNCANVSLTDGTAAILIAAVERPDRALRSPNASAVCSTGSTARSPLSPPTARCSPPPPMQAAD
jgi:hypothetical protein